MKATLGILITAIIGLAAQNYRLGLRVGHLESRREAASDTPQPVRYLEWKEEEQGREAYNAKEVQRIKADLDGLSNALSDKGITWYPAP